MYAQKWGGGINIAFDNEQTLGTGTTTADYDRLLLYGIVNGNAVSGGYIIKINDRTVAMKYVYSSKYVELNSIIVPAGTTLKITDYSGGSSLPSGSTFKVYY